MTVSDLIDLLSQYDPNLPVWARHGSADDLMIKSGEIVHDLGETFVLLDLMTFTEWMAG